MTGDPLEVIARELCRQRSGDPDARSPGRYWEPPDSDDDRDLRYDGLTGVEGDAYREPWSHHWKQYRPDALAIVRALDAAGLAVGPKG